MPWPSREILEKQPLWAPPQLQVSHLGELQTLMGAMHGMDGAPLRTAVLRMADCITALGMVYKLSMWLEQLLLVWLTADITIGG